MMAEPKKSLRRLGQELGCSKATAQRIAATDLKLYPYKITVHQKLEECDENARKRFSAWFLRKCETTAAFVDNVWFSDEAHFHLDGRVNSQNHRFWATAAPEEVAQRPLHSKKCTAWCAISSRGVIGPFRFEDAEGNAVTINSVRYRQVLAKFWKSLQQRCKDDPHLQWLQKDGATAHSAAKTRDWLRNRFGERVISAKEANPWPARSPDLTPADFFLWGHLKSVVYTGNPQSIP